MEQLEKLLNEIKERLEGLENGVDEDSRNKAKGLVDDAEQVIIISTDAGQGFVGDTPHIVTAWATLTQKIMKETEASVELLQHIFDICVKIKDATKEEELQVFKEELDKMRKEDNDDDINKKIDDINKKLEELSKKEEE